MIDSVKNRDIAGGSILVAVGIGAAIYALRFYPVGSIQQMGAGMFPAACGFLLAGLGLLVLGSALLRPNTEGSELLVFEPRPFVWIILSGAVFAVALASLGLVAAVFGTTVTARFADPRSGFVGSLVLGVALAAISVLIFQVALGLQMPAFGGML